MLDFECDVRLAVVDILGNDEHGIVVCGVFLGTDLGKVDHFSFDLVLCCPPQISVGSK